VARLGGWVDTRGLRPPSVRPNHLAAPWRRRAPGDVPPPGAKVSGSQTDLRTPWHDVRAEIIPFQYLPVLLGWKETSLVGWDTGDMPSQEKEPRALKPPGPFCPHRLSTPHPLGWHALRAGVWLRRRRVVSSCRSADVACTKLPQPRVHLFQSTM
jgi:hypothetical protein